MHIAALLVAGSATMEDAALNARQIPTTSYEVDQIPLWLTVPLVLIVHAPRGGDYDPELFVVCKDPGGTRRGTIRTNWHWPDDGDKPSKYRCFSQQLSFAVESQGEYTIGAYLDADGTEEVATPIPFTVTLGGAAHPLGSNGDSA
jgi:hypothetical protein